MDIKDFILISGGILITMVLAHGFWIAWKNKREPYRLDILPDMFPNDDDDMSLLRGELPNGHARVVKARSKGQDGDRERQESLAFPTLTDPVADPSEQPQPSESAAPTVSTVGERPIATPEPVRPKVQKAPPRKPANDGAFETTDRSTPRASVRDVDLADAAPVDELLVINLLAPKGFRYDGESLVNALRAQGLRYGDMNIFHRIDLATKAQIFSVANVLEPGTFDLADLNTLNSPGMSFFMRLPGPDDAVAALEDMLETANKVALELGGELRDDQLSVITPQTKEHLRQRVVDYNRRRLSKRA